MPKERTVKARAKEKAREKAKVKAKESLAKERVKASLVPTGLQGDVGRYRPEPYSSTNAESVGYASSISLTVVSMRRIPPTASLSILWSANLQATLLADPRSSPQSGRRGCHHRGLSEQLNIRRSYPPISGIHYVTTTC